MRRRFQFSIRTVLLLTLLASLPYGWHAAQQRAFRERFKRVNAFDRLGGTVDIQFFDKGTLVTGDGAENNPPWVFSALHMANSKMTDKELALVEPLDTLKTLDLRGTKITDAGLKRLHCLGKLRVLNLEEALVTDAGVAELQKRLPDCKITR